MRSGTVPEAISLVRSLGGEGGKRVEVSNNGLKGIPLGGEIGAACREESDSISCWNASARVREIASSRSFPSLREDGEVASRICNR